MVRTGFLFVGFATLVILADGVSARGLGKSSGVSLRPPALIGGSSRSPSHPDEEFRRNWERTLKDAQDKICRAIEAEDGVGKFREDKWTRAGGGGGVTRVLVEGKALEKGGVNVSVVWGKLPELAKRQMAHRIGVEAAESDLFFYAAGLSLVLHPWNPMAPTVHANYRFFQLFRVVRNEAGEEVHEPVTWWFGGGSDLTPSYLFEEDAEHFHSVLSEACEKNHKALYRKFKAWCDTYFYLPHRNEHRGIGGIFFDDMNSLDPEGSQKDPVSVMKFARDCLHSFIPAYLPLLARRKDILYTHSQKRWQQIRRGRYVEFNLLHDRGTKFGLQIPNSRIESILMSLPLTARWEYMHVPRKGTWEQRTVDALSTTKDWVK